MTPQELRHAKYGGEFITTTESLAEWMLERLPAGFPNFAAQSRKQMKDIELTAHLLLLLEDGPKGSSQTDLDKAFNDRDESWEKRKDVEERFRSVVQFISSILNDEADLTKSRLKNQADFYSLFGAVDRILLSASLDESESAERLTRFLLKVEDEEARGNVRELREYFEAARSASNDTGPRSTRLEIIEQVLLDEIDFPR